MPHPLLDQAVHNNARWIDTVCHSHGIAGRFADSIWYATQPAPQFYPNAVTLRRDATSEQMALLRELRGADLAPGWGVKDSYRVLDLESLGFRPLFDATWIGLPDTSIVAQAGSTWQRIDTAAALTAWEAAWRGTAEPDSQQQRIFLPALLRDPDVAVLAARQNDQIVAGAIANRTGDVVGLSNVFVPAMNQAQFHTECIATIGTLFPTLPIVGYEADEDVAAFAVLGFVPLGPLRVWLYSGK